MYRSVSRILIVLLTLGLLSCKSEDGGGLDLLAGEGSGGNGGIGDELEITSAFPEQTNVVIEIGESEDFIVSAQAPEGAVASYSWTYDGSPVPAVNNYTITGLLADVGDHVLVATVSDGFSQKSRTWNIKVNGPPIITPVTAGTPKVSFYANINIDANAVDPNGDALTYTWLLDGVPSVLLVGSNGTANLSGDPLQIGAHNVTLQVSDGSKTDSYTWNIEMNYFPQACNELTTGEICTYAGGAHKGSGLSPTNTLYPLRFRPYAFAQDAIGNYFVSDWDNNVVWYWNRTGAAVTRIGQTIAANTVQVVAGTGEDRTGSPGLSSLVSPLNNPRGVWYDDGLDRLFIAETQGNQVKYVDSSGTVFIGMGGGPSQLDGDPAFSHDCDVPINLHGFGGDIYVSCYNEHRVKRWNLATDLAYTVAGDGGNDAAGENTAPASSGVGTPYGVYADANGVYITTYNHRRVRFVNTTGAPITFWAGNPEQVTVNPGMIATIMGDGGGGEAPTNGNPISSDLNGPASVWVRNGNEIYVTARGRDDLVVGNNSGVPLTIDSLVIPHGQVGRFNHTSGGYNGSAFGVNSTRFNDFYFMAVDNQNNDHLIVADYANTRMRLVDLSNGDVAEFLGSGRSKNGHYGDIEMPIYEHLLDYPTGLAYDNSTQDLFIADQNNHVVRVVNKFGEMQSAVGRGDSAGDPLVENERPSEARPRTNINGNNSMNNGFDIWTDGSLLQLNSYGHNVRIWNRSGSDQVYLNQFVQDDRVTTVAGDYTSPGTADGPATTAQMLYPNSVKFYNNGGNMELFIADTMNHCIRHVDSAGNMTTVLGLCGTSGDPGNNVAEASARFNRPRGLVVDSLGNLFISDYNNHHIWYWNRTAAPVTIGTVTINPNFIGVVSCVGGTGGSAAENVFTYSARCNQPAGLAINGNDLCYAQRNRHNVRCFDMTTGVVRTVAGNTEASPVGGSTFDFAQEGVQATSATLLYPSNITFDGSGDMYISDTYNHVIRKVKLSP